MRDPSGYGQIRLESTCPAGLPAAQRKEPTMAEITEREQRQIDQANSSGKTPVVFIHGLGLLPSSWDKWGWSVRGERLHGCNALMAGRPGNGRGSPRQSRGLREEDPEAGCRPHRPGDRPARQEARRDGPFDGRPAHLHDRRPGALSRLGGLERRSRHDRLGRAATAHDMVYVLTAPIVKPVMKRSSNRLKTNAIGTATSTADAWSDCQKKMSPRTSSVGTPVLITLWSDGDTNASA